MVTKWSQHQSAYHADVVTDPGGNASIYKLAAEHCNQSELAFYGMGPTFAILVGRQLPSVGRQSVGRYFTKLVSPSSSWQMMG